MPDARPTHDWQVTPKLLSSAGGVALVKITVLHADQGSFDFGVRLEWAAGQEVSDIEAGALAILGTSMQALSDECRHEMLARLG